MNLLRVESLHHILISVFPLPTVLVEKICLKLLFQYMILYFPLPEGTDVPLNPEQDICLRF